MPRPHAAAVLADALNRRVEHALERRGWKTKIVPFTGYGTVGFVRVMGRVLHSREPLRTAAADADATAVQLRAAEDEQRGWRSFVNAPAMDEPITVRVGDQTIHARTDRQGLIDVTIRGHGLRPGWHTVVVTSPDARTVDAAVLIVGSAQTFGIVCDIDDTVLSTSLPRPMVAAWNTFVREEATRRPVPGMATMIRDLLDDHPGAPLIFLSTGAWNTAPALTRFLRRNGFPVGPMLLTDWGPTSTGWFRSGQEHKRRSLHRLARELPHIQWLLVGDDGQNDPKIYGEFAEARPDAVRAIALRQLSATEQVLSHLTPVSKDDLGTGRRRRPSEVPVCRASDGYGLARLVRVALGESEANAEPVAPADASTLAAAAAVADRVDPVLDRLPPGSDDA